MNTLKKTVAVVLAVAMVLTMGIATSFAAFPDVPSTANYAEAVNILTNLGIITGADDGTFKPNNSISRAEVAAIMTRALNLDEMPGETAFSDVPANHWAAGYINAAQANSVINGRGDGTFDPNGDVSYEEAVKMLIAGMGFTIQANGKGGWPTGYLAVASEKKISNNTGGTVGQPATRATVAKLIYNALEVDMMDQITWGSDVNYQPKEGYTLLSKHDVVKADVVVDSSYFTKAAGQGGSYDPDDHQVTLKLLKDLDDRTFESEGFYDKGQTMAFEEGGTAAASLLGYACVAYVGYDEDTDDPTIFAISAKNGRNTVVTVTSEQLADYDEDLSTTEQNKSDDGTVYYWRNSSNDKRAASVTPAKNDAGVITAKVYDNYADATGSFVKGSDYKTNLANGGVVSFIDNNNDGDFDYAMVREYTQEGVVKSVRVNSDGEYIFSGMDKAKGVPENYDPEDDTKLKLFIKGENYIEPSEIAVGDTITTVGDEDRDAIILYLVSSEKAEGVRSGAYDPEAKTLVISGADRTASPMIDKTDDREDPLRPYRNSTGTFYFNSDGLVSLVDVTSTVTGDYGYLIAVDDSQSFGKMNYEVKILDAATARVNTYNLTNSKLNVSGFARWNNETSHHVDNDDDVELEYVYGILADIANNKNNGTDRVIKYTAENNALTRVILASSYDDIEDREFVEKTYDADDRTIGSSDPFTDDTFVFVVKSGKNGDYDYSDDDNISVVKGGRFVDRDEYTITTFSENDVVAAAVQASDESDIDLNENVFVVRSFTAEQNDDEDNVIVFQGIQGGANRTFSLYDDNDGYADKIASDELSIGKGTILMVGPVVNGFVDAVDILVRVDRNNYNVIRTSANETSQGSTDYFWDIGQLNPVKEVDKNGDVVASDEYVSGSDINIEGYNTPASDETGNYRVRSNTNITVVDYTASRYANVNVKSGSLNDIDVSPAKGYQALAFFRVSDVDEIANLRNGDLDSERSAVTDLVFFKWRTGEDGGIQLTLDGARLESYYDDYSYDVPTLDEDIPSLDDGDDLVELDDDDNGSDGLIEL